jgi:hypothetical protein
MPEAWGRAPGDETWHYLAFEELDRAAQPSGYVGLCTTAIFADEAILTRESDPPGAACETCLAEMVARAASFARVIGAEAAADPEADESPDMTTTEAVR